MGMWLPGGRRLLPVLLAAVALGEPVWAAGTQLALVKNPGRALPHYRNSHATAVGCWLDLAGLRRPGEDDRTLIATAAVVMEFCACDRPGDPTAWRVREGLQQLLGSRDRAAPIEERARYSHVAEERADFSAYARSIEAGVPVIVTFCYDPDARPSLQEAALRISECASAVGVGYAVADGQRYLVCHDGAPPPESDPGQVDRARAEDLALPEVPLLKQPGTALYRWDGTYANLVMTFVKAPGTQAGP